jgi:hypothetical protein
MVLEQGRMLVRSTGAMQIALSTGNQHSNAALAPFYALILEWSVVERVSDRSSNEASARFSWLLGE